MLNNWIVSNYLNRIYIEEIKEIHSRKNHDYAGDDPLSNFKVCEKMGIPAWKGALGRISDKFSRVCNIVRKGEYEVQEESVKDTLMDLAVYSIICIILYQEYLKERGDINGSIN